MKLCMIATVIFAAAVALLSLSICAAGMFIPYNSIDGLAVLVVFRRAFEGPCFNDYKALAIPMN
jgi:hypothetical protein